MKLIAVTDMNWGIGRDNTLLFDLPKDRKFFREMTTGGIVVMGRGTFDSIGRKALPRRINIVLSHADGTEQDVVWCRNTDELKHLLLDYGTPEVWIIGGSQIYREIYNCCTEAYITKVHADGGADTFMPDFDAEPGWYPDVTGGIRMDGGFETQIIRYRNSSVKKL